MYYICVYTVIIHINENKGVPIILLAKILGKC